MKAASILGLGLVMLGAAEVGAESVRVAAAQAARRVVDFRAKADEAVSAVERNLDALTGVIERAGAAKCDVLVLPEDTPGLLNWVGANEEEAAKVLPRAVELMVGRLGAAAARHRMYLVVCSDHVESDGGIYNTAFLLGRDGKEMGRYHKVCPTWGESGARRRGRSFPVFPTPDLGTAGMLICYDLVVPETARCLALQGADIIFFPTMGGAAIGDDDIGEQALRVRAAENFIWLVVAHRGNGAMIISPQGKIVARAEGADGLAIAEIDPRGAREGGDALNRQRDMRARLFRERNPEAFGILTDPEPPVIGKVPIGLTAREAGRIMARALTVGEEEFREANRLLGGGAIGEARAAFERLRVEYPGTWIDRRSEERLTALPGAVGGAEAIWPLDEWAAVTPESRGMSAARLDAAAEYALQHGGGSGCVVRHGRLVKEWGDPAALTDIKSATKGSVGTTMLGLAVDEGLVGLDDRAQTHYPAIGTEIPANRRDWLGEITVRHLATMTAGFDDGRPPTLVRRPGSGGFYSNDTSNMLAELLTLRWNADLQDIFKRRVMDVIGVRPDQWAWRENSYRSKSIGGVKSREFASGITITSRALARIGYLYLRDGEWNGKRVLSRDFIAAATRPTELPAFVPSYAFYWGSNARGTYAQMPKDTYWALGLGDSFVAVCPSLDIVAVRLGTGSNRSRLPGDPDDNDWGKRVEGFFSLVVNAIEKTPVKSAGSVNPPLPPSPVIENIEWAPVHSIVRRATGSDNWPLTWADDDALYGAYGDGRGFEPFVPEKLSMGFARIRGSPTDFTGTNLRSPTGETHGDGEAGRKASGLLCLEGDLFLWMRNASNSQLAWSSDQGATWNSADVHFAESFGCPTFLNFGKNYAGARDDFVYVYSPDSHSAYTPADSFVLARVPKSQLRDRRSFEFFAGLDASQVPAWNRDITRRQAVLTHPGRCYRPSVTWHSAIGRYLLVQPVPGAADRDRGGRVDTRFGGGLAVFDAPEPWGPWTTAFFTEQWDAAPGDSASFPTKWMSSDGRTLHLVFSGDDCFSVRRGKIVPFSHSRAGGTQRQAVRATQVAAGSISRSGPGQ